MTYDPYRYTSHNSTYVFYLCLLKGHSRGVSSVALSADGTILATGSGDMTARLWDIASGQCTATLKVRGIVMTFSGMLESTFHVIQVLLLRGVMSSP